MDNQAGSRLKIYARIRAGGHNIPGPFGTRNVFTTENAIHVSKKLITEDADLPHVGNPDLALYNHAPVDRVFAGEAAEQGNVVRDVAGELILQLQNSVNVGFVAYGGTATGKSFTILGNKDAAGVLQSAGKLLFDKIATPGSTFTGYALSVAAQLIYKGEIKNLLAQPSSEKSPKTSSQDDPKACSVLVNTEAEYLEVVARAIKASISNASQHMSALPRGHVVLSLILHHPTVFSEEHPTRMLQFFDLNGPEKLVSADVKNPSTQESIAINEQLSSLRLLIENLTQSLQKSATSGPSKTGVTHLFSNSKLNKLLAPCLTPNTDSKVLFLLTLATTHRYHSDTKETVNFGQTLSTLKKNFPN